MKAILIVALLISIGYRETFAEDLSFSGTDVSLSGYATLGYAISNWPFGYQRFVTNEGTFKRDSLIGGQGDVKWPNGWGATLQIKAAPATNSDANYQATVAWAFISYRPSNDWLFRIGRQRAPLYLYSETIDVGVTYDFAQLPAEMYSLTPVNDFDCVSLSKVWELRDASLELNSLLGVRKNVNFRVWLREEAPGFGHAGANFENEDYKGGGFELAYRRHEDTYRISAFMIEVDVPPPGYPKTFPFVQRSVGGFYQTSLSLPGPGIPLVSQVQVPVISIGTSVGLGHGLRVISELADQEARSTPLFQRGYRGYLSLVESVGRFSPYVTWAFQKAHQFPKEFYNAVNSNTLPAILPLAPEINSSQRAGADVIFGASEQSSLALGASYAITTSSKLKAEYARTHIGGVSRLVDAPPGTDIRNQNIDVFSISYSVVF